MVSWPCSGISVAPNGGRSGSEPQPQLRWPGSAFEQIIAHRPAVGQRNLGPLRDISGGAGNGYDGHIHSGAGLTQNGGGFAGSGPGGQDVVDEQYTLSLHIQALLQGEGPANVGQPSLFD